MRYIIYVLGVWWILSGCFADQGTAQVPFEPQKSPGDQQPSVKFPSNVIQRSPSRLEISIDESEKGERAYKKEKYKSAERHFQYALRLIPENLHALSGLGWTLYDLGRPDEAFPVFKKPHELYPGDGSSRRELVYLLYHYGRTSETRKLLGSLDRERWPELANIDDELRKRKAQGLPPPEPPTRSLKNIIPDIVKEVIGVFPGIEKKENSRKEFQEMENNSAKKEG